MGKNTKIEWCNATRLNGQHRLPPRFCASASYLASVLPVMAGPAESDAVVDIEPQLGVGGEWLDMVRVGVSSLVVPAFLACEPVPREDIIPPPLSFGRMAHAPSFGAVAVYIEMMRATAYSVSPDRTTDPHPSVNAVSLASLFEVGLPSSLIAHSCDSFPGMLPAFERGYSALRILSFLYSSAREARPVNPVIPGAIPSELANDLPCLTPGAAALACLHPRYIGIKSHGSFYGRHFQCTFFGLRHITTIAEGRSACH